MSHKDTDITKVLGRPPSLINTFNQESANLICDKISQGLSIRQLQRTDGLPERQVILKWLRENLPFQTQYALAREEAADLFAEEINEIVDSCPPIMEEIQKARLQVDAKKWIACKLKPKKYGDRIAVDGDIILRAGLAELVDKAGRIE